MLSRATLDTLARALRVRPDQAEEVARSDASARAAFDRRGLFRAAGAVAAGVAFGDVVPDPFTGFAYDVRTYVGGIVDARPAALRADDYVFRAGDFAPGPRIMPISRADALTLYPDPRDTPAGRMAIIEARMDDTGWIIDADGNTREVGPLISKETAFELLTKALV